MVTGTATGTYIQFGQDIAKVAQSVGLEFLVKESEGSIIAPQAVPEKQPQLPAS